MKDTSAVQEMERRKLATVADHALPLADQGKLHLLQKRHGDGDYSYWGVAGGSTRAIVSSRLPAGRYSEHPYS
jgi:hypothetical protein